MKQSYANAFSLLGAVLICGSLLPRTGLAARPLSFNRDVRPILSDKCFFCHGPEEEHRGAELRLDDAESAHDYAIVPGEPDESELISRILEEDPDVRMPPPETGKRVSEDELAILRRWIEEGAEYEPYWAYVPPREVSIPRSIGKSADVAPAAGPIDDLVRSALIDQGLEPSPRADRRDQLRRLALDLTGLPARFEDIRSLQEASDGDEAYERWVDHYLASPAFGERFAEYWLDLVRFADTVGYHGDQTHSIAPYRDYVIDSINDGKGLDEFSIEQLAGDLLTDPTVEQQVASGYNRLLQTSHEGGVQPKEYLAIYAADRVRNFSAVWMAATVGCAQCHDHKYDPYTSEDFYSLVAFFADIDESQHFKSGTNSLPTKRFPEIDVLSRTDRLWLADLDAQIAEAEGDTAALSKLKQQRDIVLTRTQRTMVTKTTQPRTIRFLPRGNWLDDSGPVMRPSIPAFLGELSASQGERPTRLDLARWLFDVDDGIGGLTARVFANRLWYLYTGRGISPSLGDFGGQGSPPSNPELLDYLAHVLIDSDWDLKRTVREIVMSETYRQTVSLDSQRRVSDPYNDFASTQSGHRLPAETVRDLVLELSGLLDHRIGGPSTRPYQPAGYYRHLNFPTRKYQADVGSKQWRRGLYTHWQRQFLHPMLKALDAPSREECTAVRPRSNTPLEALVLLNDPTFVTAAKAFAARVLREVPDDDDARRVDRMFQLAVGRNADDAEHSALSELIEAERVRYEADADARAAFLGFGDAIAWPPGSGETERAVWSSVGRAVINLHETLYRP